MKTQIINFFSSSREQNEGAFSRPIMNGQVLPASTFGGLLPPVPSANKFYNDCDGIVTIQTEGVIKRQIKIEVSQVNQFSTRWGVKMIDLTSGNIEIADWVFEVGGWCQSIGECVGFESEYLAQHDSIDLFEFLRNIRRFISLQKDLNPFNLPKISPIQALTYNNVGIINQFGAVAKYNNSIDIFNSPYNNHETIITERGGRSGGIFNAYLLGTNMLYILHEGRFWLPISKINGIDNLSFKVVPVVRTFEPLTDEYCPLGLYGYKDYIPSEGTDYRKWTGSRVGYLYYGKSFEYGDCFPEVNFPSLKLQKQDAE